MAEILRFNHEEWFAAYTVPRHEKKVTQMLGQFEIQSFCPLYSAIHRWNLRKSEVRLPLFPGYVFVKISQEKRSRVLGIPGVVHLVGSPGKPASLPAEQIEALRKSVTARRVSPHPFLESGSTVRVSSGPLAGLEGVVLRRKAQPRIVVSLKAINQSIVFELEESDLEPATSHISPAGKGCRCF